MRKLVILVFMLFLISCKSTNLPVYNEVASNDSAQLIVSANLKGIFLHGKVTQMEIFDGCYADDYDTENVLGHIISDHSDGATNTITIPTNKELLFQFGTTEPSWNCHVQFSFSPEVGESYYLNYEMVFAGCEISLKDSALTPVTNIKFYESGSGSSKVWRRCDKI